jgi:hypothetical protein
MRTEAKRKADAQESSREPAYGWKIRPRGRQAQFTGSTTPWGMVGEVMERRICIAESLTQKPRGSTASEMENPDAG